MPSPPTNRILNPNPWVYFFIFLAGNSVLSYFAISYLAKGWVFVLGILIPFFILIRLPEAPSKKDFFKTEFLPPASSSRVLWWSLAILAIFLRFYRLTDFHLWPTGDESLHGFLAIPLSENWNWRFFYTVGEHPPLLIWVTSFFFKFFESPFFNLWFPPAFFSTIAVPLGYLAARAFFSRSFSLLLGLLWAFSFWPLYFGRFCHQGIFIPFWELAAFLLLSRILKNPDHRHGKIGLFTLGFWIGLGFLAFISWATIALFLGLIVLAICSRSRSNRFLRFLFFAIGLCAGSSPFLWAIFTEGYGHHLVDSSSANHWFSDSHQILTVASYLSSLFWGNSQPGTSYGPVWGGILNPVLSSCFLLGAAELFHKRSTPLAKWIGLGFILSLLPAFFAVDYVELNRIIQVMPFLLVIAATGIQKLIQSLKTVKKGFWVLSLLLVVSAGLDSTHLFKAALVNLWGNEPKKGFFNEGFEAYHILDGLYQGHGCGLVFTDFMPLTHNHSLNVTTYHFNSALNPRLADQHAEWAALITNCDYEPFLAKRFPGGHWYPVGRDLASLDGTLMVGVVLLDEHNRAVFEKWKQIHNYFHQLNLEAENSFNTQKAYQTTLTHLALGRSLVKGDPFLESSFDEWCAQYYFSPSYAENIHVLETALQKGYPASHLYKRLADFLAAGGKYMEAEKVFKKAAALKPIFHFGPGGEIETNEKKP